MSSVVALRLTLLLFLVQQISSKLLALVALRDALDIFKSPSLPKKSVRLPSTRSPPSTCICPQNDFIILFLCTGPQEPGLRGPQAPEEEAAEER
jgi:hypothetical protein